MELNQFVELGSLQSHNVKASQIGHNQLPDQWQPLLKRENHS